ncbi:IS3 family transposase [Pontibacter harenae]|uniref:IS3 family transposase n=1 Tax=Pontibacter harenae TaxID=2894083 RepID=UPI0034E21CA8
MCKVLQVSASGYYYWLHHPVILRERKEQELVEQIKQVYEQSKCRYGSPRIAMELKRVGCPNVPSSCRQCDVETSYSEHCTEEGPGADH